MTPRRGAPMQSTAEPTRAIHPPPAGPQRSTRPGNRDLTTLPWDTETAEGVQGISGHPKPKPHTALSSAASDLP